MMERLGTKAEAGRAAFPLREKLTRDRLLAARQRLEDPEIRLVDEFFWFWPGEGTDGGHDLALEALRCNDLQSACDTWAKRQGAGDSAATHNLAVFYHLRALELEAAGAASGRPEIGASLWRRAWSHWCGLVGEEGFWSRLQRRAAEMDDPRVPVGVGDWLRASLLTALAQIDARLAAEAAEKGDEARAVRHVNFIFQCGIAKSRAAALLEDALKPVRKRIAELCERVKLDTEGAPDRIAGALGRLLDDARPPLGALNCLLRAGNALRDGAHDEVAGLVRALLVTYGNDSNDWKSCEELLERASLLAVSPSLKSRIDDDLKTVRNNRSYQLCWFCGENQPAKPAAATLHVHGNVQRSWQGTSWKYLPVHIPRCWRCFSIHWARKLGWAAALAIAAGCLFWFLDSSPLQALIATAAAAAGVLFGSRVAWPGKTRSKRGTAWRFLGGRGLPSVSLHLGGRAVACELNKHRHPVVSAMLQDGWVLGRRPPEASNQVTAASVAWAVLWIGAFVLLTWLFSSLRAVTGDQVRESRPAASPPAASTASGLGTRPTASARAFRLASLKAEIEADRTALQGFEVQLRSCEGAVAYYDTLIRSDRADLQRMQANANIGLDVSEIEYERVRRRHNDNVELYNAEVTQCRSVRSEYKRQLDTSNSKIDEYNRLIRVR